MVQSRLTAVKSFDFNKRAEKSHAVDCASIRNWIWRSIRNEKKICFSLQKASRRRSEIESCSNLLTIFLNFFFRLVLPTTITTVTLRHPFMQHTRSTWFEIFFCYRQNVLLCFFYFFVFSWSKEKLIKLAFHFASSDFITKLVVLCISARLHPIVLLLLWCLLQLGQYVLKCENKGERNKIATLTNVNCGRWFTLRFERRSTRDSHDLPECTNFRAR